MNGNDSQTCLECHSVLSTKEIPATFAVGGAGNVSDNAFPGIVDPDIDDSEGNGFARVSGRVINPPFTFGAGGVELLGREMTADLQELMADAVGRPGTPVALVTKGVSFGTLVFDGTDLDFTDVSGIDADLIVRPFGRKGCCSTVREFDLGAMQFHHGIQPVEVVGEDVDADGDGVENEITVGEISAMHIFQTSLERPRHRGKSSQTEVGDDIYDEIGCAECHIPQLVRDKRFLTFSFPDEPTDPTADVYFEIDLSEKPTKFVQPVPPPSAPTDRHGAPPLGRRRCRSVAEAPLPAAWLPRRSKQNIGQSLGDAPALPNCGS